MNKLIFKIKLWLYNTFKRFNFQDPESIVCYVYGHQDLPAPLSSEEETQLLILKSNGSASAINSLIEHNLRLVVYVAKKFENSSIEFEDLISIGSVGLIKAVKTFNLDKNIKLATYACRCIENEILMQLRKVSKTSKDISFDKPLSMDKEGNQLLLSDVLPSEEDLIEKTVDENADRQMVYSLIEGLNSREQEIMILRYGLTGQDELTQKEVADKLGISQSYISRLEKRILDEMRVKIEKEQRC